MQLGWVACHRSDMRRLYGVKDIAPQLHGRVCRIERGAAAKECGTSGYNQVLYLDVPVQHRKRERASVHALHAYSGSKVSHSLTLGSFKTCIDSRRDDLFGSVKTVQLTAVK